MRYFVIVLGLIVVLCAGAVLFSKRGTEPVPGSQKLEVVATIFPIADWLREIGGPDIEVHCLVSGGANPHHFEPSINDALRISRARAVFAIGLGLDMWAEKLLKNSQNGNSTSYFTTGTWIVPRTFGEQTITIAPVATSAIHHGHDDHDGDGDGDEHDGHHHHHELGDADPHYWLDPVRAQTVVARMADELSKLDPAHREDYTHRAQAYVETLQTLAGEVELEAQAMPKGRKVVTFHDAYGYLLERLGVKLAAVVQVSPGIDPSPRDVSEALRIMREIGQRTVFTEPTENVGAARVVAGELGGEVKLLDPMDSEVSEAGKTYVERLRHNIAVITKALRPENK